MLQRLCIAKLIWNRYTRNADQIGRIDARLAYLGEAHGKLKDSETMSWCVCHYVALCMPITDSLNIFSIMLRVRIMKESELQYDMSPTIFILLWI